MQMALEHLNNDDKAIIKTFVFFSNIDLLLKGHGRAAVSRVSKERANVPFQEPTSLKVLIPILKIPRLLLH